MDHRVPNRIPVVVSLSARTSSFPTGAFLTNVL
jgi:hypothetical protein